MRKRISITIRSDLLGKIDRSVDGVSIRNRSHAFETYLERAFQTGSPKVFILAGDERCMKKVKNAPLLEHTIKFLKKAGLKDIILGVTPQSAKKVSELLGDGSRLDVKITYLESERSGTASAMKNAQHLLKSTFLLLYGDNFYDFDIMDLVQFHKSTNSIASVALTSVEAPGQYGVAHLQGNKVTDFNEKPSAAETYIISTGLFVLEPKIFDFIKPSSKSLEADVLKELSLNGKLTGYVMNGSWSDLSKENPVKE